ncbi:hypothetical protein WDW86_09145 [Bdellovibrionota bacterium FG-2]
MIIFEYSNYKTALRDLVLARKQTDSRITFERLASACQMQKTYLSRALNKDDVHFSSDQLYLASEYLNLSAVEREFLELLHRLARTNVPKLKLQLEKRIRNIQQSHLKTESYVAVEKALPTQGESFLTEYYLDLNLQLVHIFLTIDSFAKNPDAIRKELHLTQQQFNKAIQKLIAGGMIAQAIVQAIVQEGHEQVRRYKVLKSVLHLPADSPINRPYQALMRLHSTARLRLVPENDGYSYSVFFSTDANTKATIQRSFMEWLESVRKKVQASEPTGIYQLAFDLVPWSRSR